MLYAIGKLSIFVMVNYVVVMVYFVAGNNWFGILGGSHWLLYHGVDVNLCYMTLVT